MLRAIKCITKPSAYWKIKGYFQSLVRLTTTAKEKIILSIRNKMLAFSDG